ncbi:MAG: hypothetical protein RSB87_02525 [Clostridia bacterium]
MKKINKKGLSKISIILLSLVLVIVLALGGVAIVFISSPKFVAVSAIEKAQTEAFKYIDIASKKIEKIRLGKAKIKGDFKVTAEASQGANQFKDYLDILNNTTFSFDATTSVKENMGVINASLKYKDQASLDLNSYMADGRVYIKIKDVIDEYVYSENSSYAKVNEQADLNNEKVKIESIKTAVVDLLKKENFSKAKEAINIEGKILDVKKISYKLNVKQALVFEKNVLNALKADVKYLEAEVKLRNAVAYDTVDKVKTKMDLEIAELDKELETLTDEQAAFTSFEFNVFIKGIFAKPVRYAISVGDKNTKTIDKVYELTNYKTEKADMKLYIKEGVSTNEAFVKKLDKDKYTISAFENDKQVLEISGLMKPSNIDVTYQTFKLDTKMYGGSLKLKTVADKPGNEKTSLLYVIEGSTTGKVTVTSNMEMLVNQNIAAQDVSKATPIKDIKSEDMLMKLMLKLQKCDFYQKIMQTNMPNLEEPKNEPTVLPEADELNEVDAD